MGACGGGGAHGGACEGAIGYDSTHDLLTGGGGSSLKGGDGRSLSEESDCSGIGCLY
jgi:hypothetical protein